MPDQNEWSGTSWILIMMMHKKNCLHSTGISLNTEHIVLTLAMVQTRKKQCQTKGNNEQDKTPNRPSGLPKSPTAGGRSRKATAAASVTRRSSAASASGNSTDTNSSNPLPHHFAKALAQEIERKSDGIEHFKAKENKQKHTLESILNSKTHVFGNQDDPMRARICQKAWKWKQLTKSEHQERVLIRHSVKSCAELKKTGELDKPTEEASDTSVSEDSDKEHEDNLPVKSPPSVITTKKKTETESTQKQLTTPTARETAQVDPAPEDVPAQSKERIEDHTSPSRVLENHTSRKICDQGATMSSAELSDFPSLIGK